ncbi:Anaphase-promoting complex subunit cdc20 [Diplonema papillatum]|nr:Anaphase-promoting complex subunit cdc20 [Diplonema papillatum]|eukprot:gene12343-19081_t
MHNRPFLPRSPGMGGAVGGLSADGEEDERAAGDGGGPGERTAYRVNRSTHAEMLGADAPGGLLRGCATPTADRASPSGSSMLRMLRDNMGLDSRVLSEDDQISGSADAAADSGSNKDASPSDPAAPPSELQPAQKRRGSAEPSVGGTPPGNPPWIPASPTYSWLNDSLGSTSHTQQTHKSDGDDFAVYHKQHDPPGPLWQSPGGGCVAYAAASDRDAGSVSPRRGRKQGKPGLRSREAGADSAGACHPAQSAGRQLVFQPVADVSRPASHSSSAHGERGADFCFARRCLAEDSEAVDPPGFPAAALSLHQPRDFSRSASASSHANPLTRQPSTEWSPAAAPLCEEECTTPRQSADDPAADPSFPNARFSATHAGWPANTSPLRTPPPPHKLLPKRFTRRMTIQASRVLDAPDIAPGWNQLLAWSSRDLAVALGSVVYLRKHTGVVLDLIELRSQVASIRYSPQNPASLAAAFGPHVVVLDTTRIDTIESTITPGQDKISSLAHGGSVLAVGSTDGHIALHDLRTRRNIPPFAHHAAEVTSVQWSPDSLLLASSSLDRTAVVWCIRQRKPVASFQQDGPVFDVAWNLQSTGQFVTCGGLHASSVCVYSTLQGKVSAVSLPCVTRAVLWATDHIVVGHGDAAEAASDLPNAAFGGLLPHSLTVWKPSAADLSLHVVLTGHYNTVCHLAASPDHRQIASASPDESVRFWDFGPAKPRAATPVRTSLDSMTQLR